MGDFFELILTVTGDFGRYLAKRFAGQQKPRLHHYALGCMIALVLGVALAMTVLYIVSSVA